VLPRCSTRYYVRRRENANRSCIVTAALSLSTTLSDAGVCSYCARSHNGHITAGGEKFDSNALTAAHCTYPMGTKLRLTNISYCKTVDVVVNDRGPFAKGREISVARRAAQELGFITEGLKTVRIEKIQ
jgi:rare lipoprotein A